ncbi:MAG: hypothetical protein JWQ64_2039 [Subtercola sp.]|nr:hypothetical protein [Subtercola sp.]
MRSGSNRRWTRLIPLLLIAASVVAISLSRASSLRWLGFFGAGLLSGLILYYVLLWVLFRKTKRLDRETHRLRPSAENIPVWASNDLKNSIRAIRATQAAGPLRKIEDFIGVSVTAEKLELWQWSHGHAIVLIRVPWSSVTRLEMGKSVHFSTVDDAIHLQLALAGLGQVPGGGVAVVPSV